MPIRRADRLFDILRILRSAKAPVTAASIADELEVTNSSIPSQRWSSGSAYLEKLQRALEAAGIEFIDSDAPGVRLRKRAR